MQKNNTLRMTPAASSETIRQRTAVAFCILFGLALIANNQLAGEGLWFWCATLFHGGVKLYSDLHLVYQPLTILETNLWINLFGKKVLVTEIPSVFFLLSLCVGLYLLLKESDWPDWQKAIVLVGSFMLWVAGSAYRFDDYHVTTECYVLYSLILLLLIARTDATRRQLFLTISLGVLSGFTITSRINDGGALLASTCICLLVLPRCRKILVAGIYVVVSFSTAIAVVLCTGDTLAAYASSTITKASGSKGGSNGLLTDPFLLPVNAIRQFQGGSWIYLVILATVVTGILVQRFLKNDIKAVVGAQLGLAFVVLFACSSDHRAQLVLGTVTSYLVPVLVLVMYGAAIAIAGRYMRFCLAPGGREWDHREILILIPLAQLASNSLSSAANPRSSFYAHFALLLMLITILQPLRKQNTWANGSFITILALVAITQTSAKIIVPYDWDNQRASPMFVNIHWYRHPVYGPIYINRDLLQFSQSICSDIGTANSKPELLSVPFSYPNFFCNIPPWHGYVQTFFDTTGKSTMDKLLTELQTTPPQWIVYQRQLFSMAVQEKSFNHGQPLPQHIMDDLIVQKIATGQWQLVEKRKYQFGDGWYIIRTRP